MHVYCTFIYMFSINIISVIFFNTPYFAKLLNTYCGSRKISNFEKWLGLTRSLRHPCYKTFLIIETDKSRILKQILVSNKNVTLIRNNNDYMFFWVNETDKLSIHLCNPNIPTVRVGWDPFSSLSRRKE